LFNKIVFSEGIAVNENGTFCTVITTVASLIWPLLSLILKVIVDTPMPAGLNLYWCVPTSIGANVRESEHAQSKADFIHKLSISLKEANETEYWLDLLYETNYLTDEEFRNVKNKNIEILKLLTSIINTSKNK